MEDNMQEVLEKLHHMLHLYHTISWHKEILINCTSPSCVCCIDILRKNNFKITETSEEYFSRDIS